MYQDVFKDDELLELIDLANDVALIADHLHDVLAPAPENCEEVPEPRLLRNPLVIHSTVHTYYLVTFLPVLLVHKRLTLLSPTKLHLFLVLYRTLTLNQ